MYSSYCFNKQYLHIIIRLLFGVPVIWTMWLFTQSQTFAKLGVFSFFKNCPLSQRPYSLVIFLLLTFCFGNRRSAPKVPRKSRYIGSCGCGACVSCGRHMTTKDMTGFCCVQIVHGGYFCSRTGFCF